MTAGEAIAVARVACAALRPAALGACDFDDAVGVAKGQDFALLLEFNLTQTGIVEWRARSKHLPGEQPEDGAEIRIIGEGDRAIEIAGDTALCKGLDDEMFSGAAHGMQGGRQRGGEY